MRTIPDRYPWRLKCLVGAEPGKDPSPNILTGQRPKLWNGNDLQIQIAFMDATGTYIIDDVSLIASVSVTITAAQGNKVALLYKLVQAADINQGLTQEGWDSGTDQHLVVNFSRLETNLDLSQANTKSLWLAIAYNTTHTPSRTQTPYAGAVDWYEDSTPSDEGSIVGNNFVPQGSVYDGSGNKTITGLEPGRSYMYQQGANDLTLVNGSQTLTANEGFLCYNGTIVLTGTPGAAVTATVRAPVYLNSDECQAMFMAKSEANSHWRYRDGGWQVEDAADGKWLPIGANNRQWSFGDPVD